MKEPSLAPMFACLYPGLCEITRKNGYALAIHGSLIADMDLVAVPWTDAAIDGEDLKDVLMDHIGACGYADLLKRGGMSDENVDFILQQKEGREASGATRKPHGRLAWNLHLDAGAKIDLSIMPRIQGGGETSPMQP